VWGTPTGWLKITNNHFQLAAGGDVVQNHTTVPATYATNKYYSTDPTVFQSMDARMAFPQWTGATGDTGSAFGADSFPDPDRTIATYMASLGQTATLDAFMTQVRAQSKNNWRAEYTSKAVGDYIRGGFGVTAAQ
jgi:hypothetical protein